MSAKSRVKITDLFHEVQSLKLKSQRVDMRWLEVQRTCVAELSRLQRESLQISKELNRTLTKLERAGFSLAQIYERTKRGKS